MWKFLIFVMLFTTSCGQSTTSSTSLEQQLVQALESVRPYIPQGYPEYGVPPLDPFRMEQFQYQITQTGMRVDFEAFDISILNAKDFSVQEVRFYLEPLGGTFKLHIPILAINASRYTLKGRVGFFFAINNSGKLNIELHNVNTEGTIEASVNGSRVQLDDIIVKFSVETVRANLEGASGMINGVIETFGADIVNNQGSGFIGTVKLQLIPVINDFLSKLKVEDLIL